MADANNRFKKIAYNYDLISGKVNFVAYQANQVDAFYHQYKYDADNRLTEVYTSKDSIYWENDAVYDYYRHGPLARIVLGQNQVQGIDYAYTLQGWLKGVNSTSVNDGTFDMGADGKAGSANANVARDAYGFSLNYYNGDYKPIGSSVTPFATTSIASDLFNGNIKSMALNIPVLGDALTFGYTYDQLNRLKKVDAYNGLNNTTNVWTPVNINDYKESLTYDPNGNIKTYLRNGTGSSLNLNNYSYSYTSVTNKLLSITNSVNSQTKTYSYDEIGNTIIDGMQGTTNGVWNVYGKLQSLTNKDGQNVTYTYSADGQRISKKVGTTEKWYVRDGSGNIMETYTKDVGINNDSLTVTEQYKYGSSLLDIKDAKINVENPVADNGFTGFERGDDSYILTDGNGNTKATISDKKIQHSSDGTTVDYYLADVRTATLHSSFGANAKTYNGGFIAANFNGHRKSLEIGADAQTAQFWEYNGDVGRRWNLDPVYKNSPYAAFGGNPMGYSDPLGLDTINLNRATTRMHISGSSDEHSDALVTPSRTMITQSGDIVINKAKGNDVFRLNNITIDIDEHGNQTKSSTSTTLELNDPQTFYRTGGHNAKGYIDDRFALAANAPSWLLNYYSKKSGDIGVRSALVYQKDLPFVSTLNKIMNVAYVIGGAYGVVDATLFRAAGSEAIGFNSMRDFTNVYGTAPKGYNWHHFVEQRLAKNGAFEPQLIYSTENSISRTGAGLLTCDCSLLNQYL